MKLNYKRTLLCGFGFFAICLFWQLYDNVVPLILKFDFNLNDTVSGWILTVGNLSTMFLLPLFGSISDKTNTRIGKRMPYIIFGILVGAVAFTFLPFTSDNNNFLLFMIVLFVAIIALGICRSPVVSLMPDITPRPLQSKGNAMINLVGTAGALSALVVISAFMKTQYYVDCSISGVSDKVASSSVSKYSCSGCGVEHMLSSETSSLYSLRLEHDSFFPLFAVTAIIMVTCLLIVFISIREKKFTEQRIAIENENGILSGDSKSDISHKANLPKDVKKSLVLLLVAVAFCCMSYNAVTISFSKYVVWYWGLPDGGFANCLMFSLAAGTIANIPIGMVSEKIGRRNMLIFSTALMSICFACMFLFENYHPAINVLFVFVGISWAAFNVNAYPMVVEMCSGTDVGKYTGIYSICLTSGRILSPVITGYLLSISYKTLFPYAAIAACLSVVTFFFVMHGDVRPLGKKSSKQLMKTEN